MRRWNCSALSGRELLEKDEGMRHSADRRTLSPRSRASSKKQSKHAAKISRDNIEDHRNHEDHIMQLLHTMIRVNDLDESLKFYCDKLGMKLLRKNDFPGGKFTLRLLDMAMRKTIIVVELTHNWDTHKYDIGTALGDLRLGSPTLSKLARS